MSRRGGSRGGFLVELRRSHESEVGSQARIEGMSSDPEFRAWFEGGVGVAQSVVALYFIPPPAELDSVEGGASGPARARSCRRERS